MSFTVKNKTIDFSEDWLSEKAKDGVFFTLLSKYSEEIEYYMNDADKGWNGLNLDAIQGLDLEFSIENKSPDYKVNFKVVESEGPILGFMGYYIDTASGYILLDNVKSNKYIPIFNFYKYLKEECNVLVNPELMLTVIEKFKMAEKVSNHIDGGKREMLVSDIIHFINRFGTIQVSDSIISQLLNKNKVNPDEGGIGSTLDFMIPFKKISFLMKESIGDAILGVDYGSPITDGMDELAEIDNDLLTFLDTLKNSRKLSRANYNAFKYTESNIKDLKSGPDRESYIFRNMSAMIHATEGVGASSVNTQHMNSKEVEFTFDNINKSESRLINMYDIVEERRDESLLELDNIVQKEKSKVSNKQMKAVEQKIGVKEYIGGATLAHLSKTMKDPNDDVRNMIDELYHDVEGLNKYYVDNLTISELTAGIKKVARFYGRLLKMIDKAVR